MVLQTVLSSIYNVVSFITLILLQELKWDEARLAMFKTKAMNYFKEKFGFIDPETNSSLYTMLYSTNPEANMRCVYLSDQLIIPMDGFKFLDGGWMITVINPRGYFNNSVYTNHNTVYVYCITS